MNRMVQTLGLMMALGVAGSPANSAQFQQGGSPYKCIAVNGGNTAAGTAIISYSCSGGPEDQWNYVGGQLQGIGTANGTAMCLDVKGQGTTAGTLVDLWPCNGQQNQQWEIQSGLILAAQAQMCLDSSGGPKVGGGTQLVINPCVGANSQVWTLRGAQLELNGSFPFLCANVKASKTADGTPILAYSCNDAPNELWNYKSDHQFYGLGTDNGNNKCMTAAALTPGSLVTLSTCVPSPGSEEQMWAMNNGTLFGLPSSNLVVLSAGAGEFGLCLDSSGGPIFNGSPQLVVNTCTGAASQDWNVR